MDGIARALVRTMHEFQSREGTRNMCVANALYLRDALVCNGCDAKATAVIALQPVPPDIVSTCHVVVVCGGRIYDPSYDVGHSRPDYAETIRELRERLTGLLTPGALRYATERHLKLLDAASKINAGEFILPADGGYDYYRRQADYCESCKAPVAAKRAKPAAAASAEAQSE
jgi:hypothetical protein